MSRKIKPNQPCPCGSGRKYKKCHGSPLAASAADQPPQTPQGIPAGYTLKRLENPPQELLEWGKRLQAENERRQLRFGKGRPIISTTFKGKRYVAVGSQMHYGDWHTMHQFLVYLLETLFSAEWGRTELAKSEAERHPLIAWHQALRRALHKPQTVTRANISTAAMTGNIAAFLGLAYNLFLILNNAEAVGQDLIERLRQKSQFHGAYYETYVAATFIKAGFNIKYEDERDNRNEHAEFVATHRETGRVYSVECKARHLPNVLGAVQGARRPDELNLRGPLYNALKKQVPHTRVVFIDVNVPDDANKEIEDAWFTQAQQSIEAARDINFDGESAPPAYVLLTNLPFHHQPDAAQMRYGITGVGYKIDDFKFGAGLPDLDEALRIRAKHSDIFALFPAFTNQDVPATFDGEIPEVAYGEIDRPPHIGEMIGVDVGGNVVSCKLVDAIVDEPSGNMILRAIEANGDSHRVVVKLSSLELNAYRQNQDIFFGPDTRILRAMRDPLELYDRVLAVQRAFPPEALEKQLGGHPDKVKLLQMPREQALHELAKALVYGMMRATQPSG